jgi:hypothetical protein
MELENTTPKITGHVLLKDLTTGEILLNQKNAINFENFSIS